MNGLPNPAVNPGSRPPPIGPGRSVLAFDVGGTDIKSALFDSSGHAFGLRRTPTVGDDAGAVIDELVRLSDGLRAAHPHVEPEAVGLVVPGIVDARAGVGVFSSNLGWRNAPILDTAQARFDIPVAFDHDVRAASRAEHLLGAARTYKDAVVLIIGTGIAGAILIGGQPYAAGGYAGEIGHSPIADGPDCRCGARGCLETVASAGAIARRYAQISGHEPDGAKEVIARAVTGDVDASRVWNDALDALTMSIAQLTGVLAPEAVLIGGGLSCAGDALFGELRARLRRRLSFHRVPDIVPTQLHGNGGLIGAALRARAVK